MARRSELEKALLETADSGERAEHDWLRQFDSPLSFVDEPESSPRRQFRRIRAQLEDAFIQRLQKGELLAVGYDTRSGVDSKPAIVPPDRWRVLKPDFQNSIAKSSTFSLEGVRVFRDQKVLGSHLSQLDPFRSGMPGRTTAKHKIVAEFQRRIASNEALPSLAAEARELGNWLSELILRLLERLLRPSRISFAIFTVAASRREPRNEIFVRLFRGTCPT